MPEAAKKIRVLVVDDHKVVRVGLRAMISHEPDMEVVAEAEDGPSALAAHAAHKPDISLIDLRLPDTSGAELITTIRQTEPQAKFIILTSYDADEDVFRAIQAGAQGYLLKGTFPEGILEEAIRTVHAGQRVIPPVIAERLANRISVPALTPREIAVLELVAKGLSNREIGAALCTKPGTVKAHLEHVYTKLGVGDRTAAALVAIQRGLVSLR
jgi:two-component system, NarL family, response regulator